MSLLNFKFLKKDCKKEIVEDLIKRNDVSMWPASTLLGKLTVFAALIQSAKENVDLVLTNESFLGKNSPVSSALASQALRGKNVRVLCVNDEITQHDEIPMLREYSAQVRVVNKLPVDITPQLIENGSYLLVDNCRMAAEISSHKDNGIFWIPSVSPQKNTIISDDPLTNIAANQKRFSQRKHLFENLWQHSRV